MERAIRELGLDDAVLDAHRHDGAGAEVVGGDRVLYLEARAVARGTRPLGRVLVLRDRSDLEALAGRLDTVRATAEALRVHRHEFANRVHVVAGLLDAGRVSDPFLQSFIAATAFSARERGVPLRVGAGTLLIGSLRDVAAILGNLVGNAVSAAVSGGAPRWVEAIVLLSDDDALVLNLSAVPDAVGAPHPSRSPDGPVHGHGIGLVL